MTDPKIKIKRQIEITGLTLANPGGYTKDDIMFIFDVNEATIKKDLGALRSKGVDIHSRGKKGISIDSPIHDEVLKQEIEKYVEIAVNQSAYDKASRLLIKSSGAFALGIMTTLQNCVDTNHVAMIEYQSYDSTDERSVKPLRIFQTDRMWRLLADEDGIMKQFILTKIKSVKRREKTFRPVPEKQIDELFNFSFRSWLGDERIKVKIKFSPSWNSFIKPRMLLESQKISEEDDGSVIYEATVNSLSEIAAWIVGRGEGVTVIEPAELKAEVIKLAKGVIKSNS